MQKIYQQDIDFLEGLANIPKSNYLLGPKSRQIFIERIANFLSLLDNPQDKLKFIHITGTSGKGSTTKLLESLVKNAGYKVGSFTSPFVSTSIEKISINEQLISPKELHSILEKDIKPALDKYTLKYTQSISYFEAWLAIALLHFKKQKCDWVVLEAGLGGLHDASNVIKNTKVAAITNVGLDHTDILGNTKTKIAKDKAGIIKKNCIFLSSERDKKLQQIFKKACRQKSAWYMTLVDLASDYKSSRYFSTDKQKNNLNLALNILDVLKIKPKNIQKIIDEFSLIGRQEIIQKNPLVILDGAHNQDKINNILDFVASKKYKKLHLVLAFAENKDHSAALKKLLAKTDYLYLTRFDNPFRKSADLKKLYQESKKIKVKLPISVYNDAQMAIDKALKKASKNDLILVTGSFFLVGQLRKKWISEDYILKNLKLDKR